MDNQEQERLPKPVDYDQLYPGRFLKAGLFKGKNVTMTIVSVDIEALPQEKGGDRVRGILSFKETKMQLVLNKTNGECMRAMFGRKPQEEWLNKRVTFAPEKDRFGREVVDAIRIVGSPDISEPIDVEIRLPRKKPKMRRLQVTDLKQKNATAPIDDDDPGTHPDDREPGED